MGYTVPAGISNKHLHVSEADFKVLFGADAEMTHFKDLSQPGQFATEEKVDIVGPRGTLKGIRILGPYGRKQTQVELARTDCFAVGIDIVLRESGKLEGAPGCKLVGPAGEVEIEEGVIVAKRHIHLSTAQAEEAGVKNGDIVSVKFRRPESSDFRRGCRKSG